MLSEWRILRWALLATALGVFSASLILPASNDGPPFILPYLPVILLVLNTFTSPDNWAAIFLILPLVMFLASPFIAMRRPRGGMVAFWALAALLLLGVWIFPQASLLAYKKPGISNAWSEFSYGFYIYAIAHTIAFIGCVLAPPGPLAASRKHGFPVVIPDEKAEPPRST